MKKLITFCLLLLTGFSIKAQNKDTLTCNCPRPKDGKFINICTLVENHDFAYKKEIMQMACVDLLKDSSEIIRRKVNCMWEKYYKEFSCNGESFTNKGNVLKYAVNQGFALFIDGMVKHFGVDINIKDPADGKTLLDFVLDEINEFKNFPDYKVQESDINKRVKELEVIYKHLKNDLKAKHASEL